METPTGQWSSEILYFEGDEFFASMLESFATAKSSIYLESYIFESDSLGVKIFDGLVSALKRGVEVKVLVDGIGSPGWAARFGTELRKHGGEFRVFHSLPWDIRGLEREPPRRWYGLARWFRRLNRRNHRKLVIVDQKRAWLGSMNISDVHLKSVRNQYAWRDTGIYVEGGALKQLVTAFLKAFLPFKQKLRLDRIRLDSQSSIRLNHNRKFRKQNYADLISRIAQAKERIWITSPYFVPSGKLCQAIENAAARGIDVRILVPSRSDVFFMPWVASAFHHSLIKSGAKVYRYLPSILHAKGVIIDDWMTIGSSNFNHRSLLHDLEVDIVVALPENKSLILDQYHKDLQLSDKVEIAESSPSFEFTRLIGKALLLFRHWL